jgi:hypothetical protein
VRKTDARIGPDFETDSLKRKPHLNQKRRFLFRIDALQFNRGRGEALMILGGLVSVNRWR